MSDIKVITVDRIQGGGVVDDPQGNPREMHIQLSSGGSTLRLDIPWKDAMYLLSILKSAQLDTGFPFPDDPRMPPVPPKKRN